MEANTVTAARQEAERKELFDRVWKRVMGDNRESCPITWEESPTPAATPQTEGEAPETSNALVPAPAPSPEDRDRPRSDFPRGEAMGMLGAGCMDCVPLLQELIGRELADWRGYQALARRTAGAPARTIAAMAGGKKRRAKRLSAACFLISGVKYWPEKGRTPAIPSYLGELRQRFMREQETMAAYLAGAESTTDPCLRQLFWDHARENWDHACQIRTLVEQM